METKEVIRALREKSSMSQEQLAEKVFVTRQAVSRWETGETVPTKSVPVREFSRAGLFFVKIVKNLLKWAWDFDIIQIRFCNNDYR